ncbi:MAG: OprO/OprP family phosphate-selective porin [Hyphomonadaceae bacterium]
MNLPQTFVVASFFALAAPQWAYAQGELSVRGRIHLDFSETETSFDGAAAQSFSRAGVRRAHLGVQGQFSEAWHFLFEATLTPDATGDLDQFGVDDFYVMRRQGAHSLYFGEQKATAPIEAQTSSNTTQFNERSAHIGAFDFGRSLGVAYAFEGEGWTLAAGLSSGSLSDFEPLDEGPFMASARVTRFWGAPREGRVLHLAAAARLREAGENEAITYSTRPALARAGSSSLSAGIAGERDTALTLEGAWQHGRWGAEAVFTQVWGESFAGADYALNGYYVDVFFSLTGEPRSYNTAQGAFGHVRPARPITEGGPGQWMLAARYDAIDLDDAIGGASRGEQISQLIGLQWTPIERFVMRLNYGHTEIDRAIGFDGESDVVSFRVQYDFST